MAKSVSGKTMALFAAVMLACAMGALALIPQSAHAAQAVDALVVGQASDAQLSTQAAKTSVYVRKSLGSAKYTYNKYGLVTKIKDGEFQWRFKYSGKRMTKAIFYRKSTVSGKWGEEFKYTFKYDSHNRIAKMVAVSEGMPADLYNKTETYTYNKKNQVTKKVETYPSGSPESTTRYYYNSKGLVKKIASANATETLKYDKKGNKVFWSRVFKKSSGQNRSYTYKNAYSKGRLSKVTQSESGSSYGYTQKIKYTKKSIPKKYASAVKAQQTTFIRLVPDDFAPSVFSFKQL